MTKPLETAADRSEAIYQGLLLTLRVERLESEAKLKNASARLARRGIDPMMSSKEILTRNHIRMMRRFDLWFCKTTLEQTAAHAARRAGRGQ